MTARQFRGTAAWKKARRIALRSATVCELCGGPFRRDLGHRHPLYPSVDHLVPLAQLDLRTAQGRAVAVAQTNLRVAHMGCNASRGARDGLKPKPALTWEDAYLTQSSRWSRHWFGGFDRRCRDCFRLGAACPDAEAGA